MALFKKKTGVTQAAVQNQTPSLPELPRLPDFPSMDEDDDKQIHKLPSFPSSSLGTKFSQDTIKGAVTGEEEDEDMEHANDFDEDEMRMMRVQPRGSSRTMEMDDGMRPSMAAGDTTAHRMPMERTPMSRTTSAEPVFIRVDKFEDAMKIFHETKRKVTEIERILDDIKTAREKEEKQLSAWETEVRNLQTQIEKVNEDIFSKV